MAKPLPSLEVGCKSPLKRLPQSEHDMGSASYIVGIERQRFYAGCRYHWTICSVERPDELLSWGHAPTRELAEMAAQTETAKLESEMTQGGRVVHRKVRVKTWRRPG